MSIPRNPLDRAGSSSHRHVLLAFKYAEDAFTFDKDLKIDPTTFKAGSVGLGGAMVAVINEFTNQRFTINEAVWDFDFISSIGVSTSSSTGKIVVDDKFVPYGFLNFLNQDVLKVFNQEPGVDPISLSHVTFALKTYFIADETKGIENTVQANPFFFNIDSLESMPKSGDISPISHIMKVVGVSNSLGLMRSLTSIFQFNITHKDGNLHDEIQETAENFGLDTRESENASYTNVRKDRLDKSKPMLTLKDIFEGLEADLNQQRFVHQGQLQRWIGEIREDHVNKIIVAPQQTKNPTPKELPISFVIDLDDLYFDYNIDNRNMPFEQPEVSQEDVGLRVFPVRTGTDLIGLIERLMLLSKRVGEDAISDERKTFKITVTAEKKITNKYVINVKIRRYELPNNEETDENNTGANNKIDSIPLHFFINDIEERDVDIISFKSDINYRVGDKMLERQVDDDPAARVVYADREQATAERRPDLSFFESFYSGIRPMIGSYVIDGLESAERAGNILNLMDPYTYTQTTDYELVIRGNPFLLSDINRNPRDVIDDIPGAINYYSRPEVNPMYIKLTIFLNSMSLGSNEEIPERFYFDNFYHMYRVVNMFGVIDGSRSFYQKLMLKRTDSTI